tara:strand:- start:22 stop:276 length:255 start_codon:yes stop_codon:yes gene_type:complete
MNLNIDWGGIVFVLLLNYIDDAIGPQPYHYQGTIVIVDKKYQCPKNCGVAHSHYVYFNSHTDGMVIDKSQLGKKYKEKKSRRKK